MNLLIFTILSFRIARYKIPSCLMPKKKSLDSRVKLIKYNQIEMGVSPWSNEKNPGKYISMRYSMPTFHPSKYIAKHTTTTTEKYCLLEKKNILTEMEIRRGERREEKKNGGKRKM